MGIYKWVISPLIWVISIVTLLITLRITTHEAPSEQGPRITSEQSIRRSAASAVSSSAGLGSTGQ